MDDKIEYKAINDLPIEEIEDIVSLYRDAGWWEENPKSREIIPKMIRGSFCFMIAISNGKTIGMGRIISDGVSDAYIQDVIVKNEFRQHHIGQEIVRKLSQYCQDLQMEWISIVAAPNTFEFYEKLGYHVLIDYIPMILENEQK